MTAHFAVLGEGMIEISGAGGPHCSIGYGGDTLNTAIHLARLGQRISFLTALGSDGFSDRLRAQWAAEGVDTRHVLTDPGRLPGLYAIDKDSGGDRRFHYWRSDSAARQTFNCAGIDAALATAASADVLYLSLITLAVMPDHIDRIIALAKDVRANGGLVAFDTNYRAALWPSPVVARASLTAIAPEIDIALSGFDDEAALFDGDAPQDAIDRWRVHGATEIIVKCGARGCLVAGADDARWFPVDPVVPVDTSGAGDAFNAGYLAAVAQGRDGVSAIAWGQRMAGWTIARWGAIPPIDQNWPMLVAELVR